MVRVAIVGRDAEVWPIFQYASRPTIREAYAGADGRLSMEYKEALGVFFRHLDAAERKEAIRYLQQLEKDEQPQRWWGPWELNEERDMLGCRGGGYSLEEIETTEELADVIFEEADSCSYDAETLGYFVLALKDLFALHGLKVRRKERSAAPC